MTTWTRGRLLVATPPLVDPNFDRSVVLMLEHTTDGAFGLVINRPSGVSVDTAFPQWAEVIPPPEMVFVGGPVQPEAMIALAFGPCEPAEGWSPVLDHLGTADLSRPVSDLPELAAVRVFSGYSGWSPGQLDREMAQHAWIVVDSHPGDPFTEFPDDLWRTVLARQGGELSWLANYPDDVAVN